jgi:hypothetical protein
LHLGLLIDREDHGLLGGVPIETDHIDQLLLEGRVRAALERRGAVRLEVVVLPDSMNGHVAHAELGGERAGRPVGLPAGLGVQSSIDDPTYEFGREFGLSARAGSVLADARNTKKGEARTPSADRDGVGVEGDDDLMVGLSLGGPQDDLRAENQSLGDGSVAGPVFKFDTFFGGEHYRGGETHGGL